MQIDPGPMPTLIISAPELYNFFAASPVAIFPTQIGIFLVILLIFDNIFNTFSPTINFLCFTFLISKDCFFISKFLCMIPIPPSLAIAIAIFDSVTVSIAEVKKGTLREIFLVNCIEMFVLEGKIFEYLGSNKTSSKVRASFIVSI